MPTIHPPPSSTVSPSSCQISDDCHHNEVKQDQQANKVEDQVSAPVLWRPIKKRNQEQKCARQREHDNSKHFSIENEKFRGYQLECLEHENEMPLMPDTRRRRRELVGFLTQFPGEKCGKRCQHADGQNP